MSVRNSSTATVVPVAYMNTMICVRVAMNNDNRPQPRVILGKCLLPGKEQYFIWATRNVSSNRSRLTYRITGWQPDGRQLKPPQATSVRFSAIRLDSSFDGLQRREEAISIAQKAFNIYEARNVPLFVTGRQMRASKESPVMQVESPSPLLLKPSMDLLKEVADLKEKVTGLEDRVMVLEERERAAVLWDTQTGKGHSQHAFHHHFLNTVLCEPEASTPLKAVTYESTNLEWTKLDVPFTDCRSI